MQNAITATASAAHPKVFTRDGRVFTDSLSVAQTFDREHRNVLRDIERLQQQLKQEGYEDRLKFEQISFNDSYGREQPAYLISRDGFALLAFGFTGRAALRFKLKYIEAFNQMEEKLKAERQPQLPQVQTQNRPTQVALPLACPVVAQALEKRSAQAHAAASALNEARKQGGMAMLGLCLTMERGGKGVAFAARLAEYRNMGLTQKEAAKLLGVSKDTVQRTEGQLKAAGISFASRIGQALPGARLMEVRHA